MSWLFPGSVRSSTSYHTPYNGVSPRSSLRVCLASLFAIVVFLAYEYRYTPNGMPAARHLPTFSL